MTPRTVRAAAYALALLLPALLGTPAWAQPQRLATLELGFGGAPVADAWNPIRLVLRDVGPVELELAVDQGSLRDGAIPFLYRATVRGGSGLSVFDDEVYLPAWRSLSWTVRSGGVTVASGSLPRVDAERREVDLIVTASPGAMRGLLDSGARAIDVPPDRLLPRTAAYDGVRSVLVAGDGELPRADALVAAATAGAVVVLGDAALDTPLGRLAPVDGAWRRVGAGWIVTDEALADGPAVLAAARFDHDSVVSALIGAGRLRPPSSLPSVTLLFGAAAYALGALVLMRFGGVPGLAAAAALGAAASVVAWSTLRPASPTFEEVREMVVGGGTIGQRWRVHDVVSLPATTVRVDAASRPAVPAPLLTTPAWSEFDVARWRSRQVVERPAVADAYLRWDAAGTLVNDAPHALVDVHVRGGPSFGRVAAGAVAAAAGHDPPVPSATARALLDLLPPGTAVGTDGAVWYLALALEPLAAAGGDP